MRFLRRLAALFHRRRFDAELEEEIQFHLDHTTPQQFGNATAIRESTRDMFAFTALENIWRDLRHGVRSLRRNPVMFLVAVLSLGVGIGAVGTIYSLVDTLLIHDVTAREPERLVRFNALSYPNYTEVRDSGVFEELAAWNIGSLRWRDGDQTREAIAHFVTANFFEVLGGVQAARGRVFASAEATPEQNPRVVVISNRFWRLRLEGDPNVIGRTLTFNNTPFTVIGVLPSNYRSVQGLGVHPEVFVPFNTALQPNLFKRSAEVMLPVGRLNRGRTREQTQQALMAVLRELERRFPNHLDRPQSLVPVQGLAKMSPSPQSRPIIAFSATLGAVVLLVLLIACANVAGLMLARGVARQREISVRLAIGAGRLQLIRQFLIESALVAGAGTLAGVALTFWAAGLLTKVVLPGMPVAFDFSPDWRLAGAAAALGVAATLLSGLMPALICSRPILSFARSRLRNWVAAAQIVVCVVLLAGAFLFGRNLIHVFHIDPGFDSAHIVWLDFVSDHEPPRDRTFRELQSRPGVEAVSWAWYLPFNVEFAEPLLKPGIRVTEQGIGPGYLNTMRIPLMAGREFNWDDLNPRDQAQPEPVIVNQAFAQAYLKDQNAVGATLARIGRNNTEEPMVVIGVSANTSFRNPGEEPVPLLQSLTGMTPSFIVRVSGSPSAIAPALSKAYLTMSERLDRGTWPARAATTLLGILAAIGLVLALIGLGGVTIYNVARRTHEIGIRMALGATSGSVLRLMLRDGLRIVAAGAVAGVVLALPLTRLLNGFLAAGVRPWDPLAFAAMLVTLFVTAGISIWLPSRRAARVDPVECLRCE
jgi:predicted permease